MTQRSAIEVLGRIPWHYFGSLSFKDPLPRTGKRRKMMFAHLYEIAKRAGVSFSSVLWCIRAEQGEKTGRDHYHYLLRLPRTRATENQNRVQQWIWRNLGGGFPRVYCYNPLLNGVSYISKCLGLETQSIGGSQYELGKFGGAELELSLSALRLLGLSAAEWLSMDGRPSSGLGAEARGDCLLAAPFLYSGASPVMGQGMEANRTNRRTPQPTTVPGVTGSVLAQINGSAGAAYSPNLF